MFSLCIGSCEETLTRFIFFQTQLRLYKVPFSSFEEGDDSNRDYDEFEEDDENADEV